MVMSTVRVWRSPEDPQTLSSSSRARHGASAMSVEPTQDSRLTRRDLEGILPANRLQTSEVESASVGFEDFGIRRQRCGATTEGVDPSQKFPNRERLGQIVVGARLESRHLVVLGSAGGQHQDVQRRPRPAESATDLDSVEIRQHEIEQDEIKCLFGAEAHGVFAELARDNLVTRSREQVGETLAEGLLVLDDENPHASG